LGTNVGARIYKFIEIKGGNSAAPPTLFYLNNYTYGIYIKKS